MRKRSCLSLSIEVVLFLWLSMDLRSYSVKDFVLSESFQKWILEPDDEVNIFWEDWLNSHPDKMALVREARSTILTIKAAHEKGLARERDQVWDMITASIHDIDQDPAGQ